jgi:hypothetical protein
MAETKRKGMVAELAIMAEAAKRGYRILVPFGEDCPYDIVVERNGKLERVQCKYTESDGKVVQVRCQCTNNWVTTRYKPTDIEWIATYDHTTGISYFVPSSMLTPTGRTAISLRLVPTVNRQMSGIHWACDFLAW